MRLISLHPDGSAHRIWSDAKRTPNPRTYLVPAHTPVLESNGESWSSSYPVVGFFYPSLFLQVFMLLKPSHIDYYCNVILPPLFASDVIFFDLELDVVIEQGLFLVTDEDEFAEESKHYPAAWTNAARDAVMTLRQWYNSKTRLFHPATKAWWRAYVNEET